MTVKVEVKPINAGFRISPSDPLCLALQEAYREVTGEELPKGTIRICGNLPRFVRDGAIPGVYHGPNQDSAHGDVESVSLEDLVRLTKVYVATVVNYLGTEEADS
jgi:succinyl-diaminopimelate desuccinylase